MHAIKRFAAISLIALLVLASGTANARFVSVDPVQANADNGQNFNRYNYGNNNPYRFKDPDGRCADGASCDQMVQSLAADRLSNPSRPLTPVDKVTIAVGIAAATASGVDEVTGALVTARALVRSVVSSLLRSVADSRPNGMPKDWARSPSDKQGGVRFRNQGLSNPKSIDEVRSMPGNPSSPNPAQRDPYMVRNVDGKFYDASGKQVPAGSAESHISANNFKFIPRDELLRMNK